MVMSRQAIVAYAPALALLLVGVGLQFITVPNDDVAWLLTIAERLLAGARPDVDFIEFNPPASYLTFVPASLVSHLMGVTPEAAMVVMMTALVVTCVVASGAILGRAGLIERWQMPGLAAASFFVLFIFSYGSFFAQREHIALTVMLPMLSAYAARSCARSPSRLGAVLSGIGGGISCCIKPYFALGLIVPFLYVLWRKRKDGASVAAAIFSPEHIATGLVAVFYVAAIVAFFPEFIRNTLPMVLTVYVPVREPLWAMLTGPRVTAFVMMSAALVPLGISKNRSPVPIVGFLSALGFLAAMFVQGRVWFDHAFPALALVMLVTGWMIAERMGDLGRAQTRRLLTLVVVAICALPAIGLTLELDLVWFRAARRDQILADELRPMLPEHPKVLAISQQNAFASVALALHGTWVGSTYFQIISANADSQLAKRHLDPATRATLSRYSKFDSRFLAEDIRFRRPDVILVDGNQNAHWASLQPEVSAALSHYRELRRIDQVSVLVLEHDDASQ